MEKQSCDTDQYDKQIRIMMMVVVLQVMIMMVVMK